MIIIEVCLNEGRKKLARSNRQQGKATPQTQDIHFFPCTCKDLTHIYYTNYVFHPVRNQHIPRHIDQ